jgi:homogentisate phytyltransferase / homogentisate geranylgeranyltransferase
VGPLCASSRSDDFGRAWGEHVVGINQITDVSIDKINKPDLPLAEGSLTYNSAMVIVLVGALVTLFAGLYLGAAWTLGMALILLLGTLYSCEPFRLKRFAVWSGLTIAVCRGVISNLATFATWHALYHDGPVDWLGAGVLGFCVFMFAYVLAIGIFKDLPDYEGDKAHNILTYAVKYGRKKAFWAGVVLLCVSYIVVIAASIFEMGMVRSTIFVALMSASLAALIGTAATMKSFHKNDFAFFYRIVWVLFYLGLGSFSAYALLG